MSRKFKTVDYAATLEVQVRLGDCLPPEHLARFVGETIGVLDLSALYARYGARGGQPYDPGLLLGILFYGYMTGVFSTRKLERATYESIPFRYLAGNLHPDHDTLAHFRRSFLAEIQDAFVQILLVAQQVGVLELTEVSQDGTKIHADASKSQAVSYQRLVELEPRVRAEVAALFALAEQAERAAKAARTGKRPGGKPPTPPTPGPRDKDQYNFSDPDSRIMKNGMDAGFDQHYNAQLVVAHQSLLVVGTALSNHPNDQREVAPTLDAIAPVLGTPAAVALDAGYFSVANIQACEERGIDPYIAPGRQAQQQTLADLLAPAPVPPPPGASPRVQMAYKLRTPDGQAIYRARKRSVEPVIGIIKEVLGFRQFSLRGEGAAAGEWCLVCLAYNLKRLHALLRGVLPIVALAQATAGAPLAVIGLLQAVCRLVTPVGHLRVAPVFEHGHRTADRRRSPPRSLPATISFYSLSPTGC